MLVCFGDVHVGAWLLKLFVAGKRLELNKQKVEFAIIDFSTRDKMERDNTQRDLSVAFGLRVFSRLFCGMNFHSFMLTSPGKELLHNIPVLEALSLAYVLKAYKRAKRVPVFFILFYAHIIYYSKCSRMCTPL